MKTSYLHRRLKAAPTPFYLFALSVIVYVNLLAINAILYAGIISMTFSLILFVFLSVWNLFSGLGKKESLKHHRWNVPITVLVLTVQLLTFCICLPHYTSTKAAEVMEDSMENVEVMEIHTMDTLEPLSPFVKKGYVFLCKNSTSKRNFTVFFDPISGDHYEMK